LQKKENEFANVTLFGPAGLRTKRKGDTSSRLTVCLVLSFFIGSLFN